MKFPTKKSLPRLNAKALLRMFAVALCGWTVGASAPASAADTGLSDFEAGQQLLELASDAKIEKYAATGRSVIESSKILTSRVAALKGLGVNTPMLLQTDQQAVALTKEGIRATENTKKLSGPIKGLGITIAVANVDVTRLAMVATRGIQNENFPGGIVMTCTAKATTGKIMPVSRTVTLAHTTASLQRP